MTSSPRRRSGGSRRRGASTPPAPDVAPVSTDSEPAPPISETPAAAAGLENGPGSVEVPYALVAVYDNSELRFVSPILFATDAPAARDELAAQLPGHDLIVVDV